MNNPSLGKYLKELRKTTSYNQIDIAVIIGKSRSTVAAYELDKTTPPPETLNTLAQIYNVPSATMLELIPVELLPEYDDSLQDDILNNPAAKPNKRKQFSSDNVARMLSFFEQLSPDKQLVALELLELFFQTNK